MQITKQMKVKLLDAILSVTEVSIRRWNQAKNDARQNADDEAYDLADNMIQQHTDELNILVAIREDVK